MNPKTNVSSPVFVFTGGGTAGHVFPGLAVVEALEEAYARRHGAGSKPEIVWMGDRSGMERDLASKAGFSFIPIRTGKLRRYVSVRNVLDLFNIAAGFVQSWFRLRALSPDALFSKGGYVSVPPVIAAHLLGIPVLTHESDVSPGLATRILYRYADIVAVSYPESLEYLPADVVPRARVCGNPVRRAFREADAGRGRRFLGVEDGVPILLVVGGSQGAMQLNGIVEAVRERLSDICIIVHQTGTASSPARPDPRYKPYGFLSDEFPDVLAAADLVLCRSGAGTVWELAALRKPAVLVPLGTATSRGDQIQNARVLERRGAALVFTGDAEPEDVFAAVSSLISDGKRLERMASAYEGLDTSSPAACLAELLVGLVPGTGMAAAEGS